LRDAQALLDSFALAVARAYLAEHPADDGEPVTAEWLKAVGFTERAKERPGDDRVLVSPEGETCHHVFWSENRDGYDHNAWFYGDDYLRAVNLLDQPTRGHVRRLCQALGVTLTEPTP
jgi:hypothetical protein